MGAERVALTSLAVLATGVLLSGCAAEQGPVAGVIAEPKDLRVGTEVSDFPVVTPDEPETSFGELREPIAILAFVNPPGEQCCWLEPKLVSLAQDVRYRRITVAQVSEPTDKCSHGPDCVASCDMEDPYLVALCDAERIAWNAYRRPEPGTVVLIDWGGEVAAVGRLADLGTVVAKARGLADEVEAFERSAYEN